MTPREKAQELIDKFASIKPIKMSDYSSIMYPTAKLCAIVAVDEILNTIEYSSQADELSKTSYWNQVKEEIIDL